MRVKNFAVLSAFLLVIFSALPGKSQVEVSAGVNFSELNDYGEWVHVHGLGRVWRPDAEPGWRPFMYGHWVYSNDGWLWDSDEPFGWIVCHYGNWYHDEEMGWVWVPGDQWSPARVEWYVTDNEIAWAPLFPPGHRQRFAREHWNFIPTPFFTSLELRGHMEVRARPERSDVRVRVYAGAPRFDFVQRFAPAPIVRVTPKKVRVTEGPRPFVRVEIEGRPRPEVVVPVRSKSRNPAVRVDQDRGFRKAPVPQEVPRQPARSGDYNDRRGTFQPRGPQAHQDIGDGAKDKGRQDDGQGRDARSHFRPGDENR